MAQEQLNKIEEQLQNHLELSRDEFRSALRTNASVLFLGQKYQTDFYGEEYFLQAASKVLECLKGAAVPNYTELWKKLTRVVEMPEGGEEFCSLPEDIVNNWDAITDAARQALQRNASEAMVRVNRTLCGGWRLVATSAPESLVRTVPGNPFSVQKTVIYTDASLPQTFRTSSLSLLQLFAPGHNLHLSFDEPDFVWETENRARNALCVAVSRALPYSGYLILDGWEPSSDWLHAQDLLYIMDELQNKQGRNQIKVICFGVPPQAFADTDRTLRRLVARITFLDGHLTDLFWEKSFQEAIPVQDEEYYHFHLLGVQAHERPLDISVPVKQWEKLPFASKSCLLPLEKFSAAEMTNVDRTIQMTAFLANNRDIPLWEGYENCYFERDLYQTLYKKAFTSLKTGIQRTDFLLLKGPACSGKTVMLGRLALDLSVHFPTIYLGPSSLPRECEGDENPYAQLAVFIREQFTKVMGNRKFNRKRVLVIWDGGFYETEAREIYYQLRHQLQISTEFLLVGSAYANPRNGNALRDDEVMLQPRLSEYEQESLYEKLNRNLGLDRIQFERALQMGNQRGDWHIQQDEEENTLLSVLSHLFRGVDDDIAQNLQRSAMNEVNAARVALQSALDRNMAMLEDARHDGALVTALKAFNCEWDEEVRNRITDCAVVLDDILAVAGRWRQSLHFELVFRVMEDLYRERYGKSLGYLGYWQALLNALLDYSPMIAWNGEDSSNWTLRYRSALEAQLFLDYRYPRKITSSDEAEHAKVKVSCEGMLGLEGRDIWRYIGKNGEALQEQVAVQVLCSVLKMGRLDDGNNEFAYEALHLADCFGPNNEADSGMIRWYPYIAQQLIRYSEKNVAALQKAAFLLRHYDWTDKCLQTFNKTSPQSEDFYKKQLSTSNILIEAIRQVNASQTSVSKRQQIQLYTEWCCNRRCLYCPETAFMDHLTEAERQLVAGRQEYGEQLLLDVEQLIRTRLIPLSVASGEYGNQRIVYIYNDMLIYNIRVHKKLGIKDLRNLAAHMDFYWQYILFGLMDMKELVNAGASQQNKINEILNSWYELSKDTQWEAGATLNLDRHDKELYQCDQGNWWINRITALWHEPLPGQTQMQGADLLKNNLYLRSLDFQWEEKNRHLSKEERARAQLIVDVMEGKEGSAELAGIRLPNGTAAHGCKNIYAAYQDTHLRLQEYYVRAKWMAETGLFPYVDMAGVYLLEPYWDLIDVVCQNYCADTTGLGKDLLLHYLHAVLLWFRTSDSRLIRRRRQPEMFDDCRRPLRAPRNGRYNTSYLLLCWSDHTTVQVTCTVELEDKCAKIIEVQSDSKSEQAPEWEQMNNLLKNKYLYVADAVLGTGWNGGNSYTFGVRFNREGPVAAPIADLPEKGGTL